MAEAAPIKARVALLMATYNQAATLPAALDSLLSQHHTQFTLTVIDDGSDDATSAILARYEDTRLSVHRTKHQGLLPSLNIAMQKSKPAAFYGVVYASCFYSPTFTGQLLQALLRHSKACGAFSHYCEGNTEVVGSIFREPRYDNNELLVRNFLGPGLLFRAEAFRQAGGLFLSARKGIWETWQRLAEQGPWIQIPQILLRWQAHSYEKSPPHPKLDPDKELYPKLQVRLLRQAEDSLEPDWLHLLAQAGHTLEVAPTRETPQVVLCGSMERLAASLELARQSYSPLLWVINDENVVTQLAAHSRAKALLGGLNFATRTLKVAAALKQVGVTPLVYMHGMTPREITRLLSRIPMLYYRNRSVILLRSYGGPGGIVRTLQALRQMHAPPDFGSLLIWCVDGHPETVAWLKKRGFNWFQPTQNNYYPELQFLLKQMPASFVLALDAGVLPTPEWFVQLWPLLADPLVGMVSGHLNRVVGPQNLPFRAQTMADVNRYWPRYHSPYAVEKVSQLSDAAFLMRKTVFEQVLESHPQTLPLLDDQLLAQQVQQLGYGCLLHRRTLAFNLMQAL
ncbi:MAG: glycosyltransferase family 2 protein [Candidatus Sericytochromatia bacterium]